MPLELGPFVGVSSNEARILFEAVPEIRFLLGLGDQGVRFILLGGDVHVGTFAVLRFHGCPLTSCTQER